MRRAVRGSDLRSPGRWIDDPPITSAGRLNRGWTARNCVCVAVLAACCTVILILLWSSRPRSNLHQSSNSGMVFPLYRYYRSGDQGMGGRRNRAGRRRRLQAADMTTNVRGGHRLPGDDIEEFYIQMKLGVPPVKYNFHIDTGSGLSWVYCKIRTVVSKMTLWGPNGLFEPEESSFLSCVGETAALCRQFQFSGGGLEACESTSNYRCLFVARYADLSSYSGEVVNASITVTMNDKSERSLFGSFGCVADKLLTRDELPQLLTDGLIGLGNCKGTLLDQWTESKSVGQSVLGVCFGKAVSWTAMPSPGTPVGYLSLGIDFKEKFAGSNSLWSRLTHPGNMIICSCAANLLHMKLAGIKKDFHSLVVFDTGSDISLLTDDLYFQLLTTLEVYAEDRGYRRASDISYFAADEQRVCWTPPDGVLVRGSPIREFRPLEFAFEGIGSSSQPDAVQYLTVEPANYLLWDKSTRRLCVNILQETLLSMSIIGADMMREHLFVFDYENQRVRWQPSNCELK